MVLADPIVHVAQTASIYSQIAGILAGFAFTTLLLYVGREGDPSGTRSEGRHAAPSADAHFDTGVLVVLFGTLASLVISAVLYGILAGGADASPNALAGIFLYGPSFSLAVLSMFFATGLAAAHLDVVRRVAQFVAGVTGPTLSMMLMALAAYDICVAGDGKCTGGNSFILIRPLGYGFALTASVFVVSLVTLMFSTKPSRRKASTARGPTSIASTTLICALGSSACAVLLDLKGQDFAIREPWLQCVETLTALLLGLFAVLAIRSLAPLSRVGGQAVDAEQEDVRVAGATAATSTTTARDPSLHDGHAEVP